MVNHGKKTAKGNCNHPWTSMQFFQQLAYFCSNAMYITRFKAENTSLCFWCLSMCDFGLCLETTAPTDGLFRKGHGNILRFQLITLKVSRIWCGAPFLQELNRNPAQFAPSTDTHESMYRGWTQMVPSVWYYLSPMTELPFNTDSCG